MNLEDIFITIVDTTNAPQSSAAKRRTAKGAYGASAESVFAKSMVERTANENKEVK